MRWTGATLLLVGCVTSGEVRKARENHLSCLDRQMVEVQAAQSMYDSAERTKATAADCWTVFHRQVAAGQDAEVTAVECRQLDAYAEMFDDRVSYYGGRATEVEASCRALGANAQELAARRDGQRAAAPPAAPAAPVVYGNAEWGMR
jgi:hypothetical protein